MPTDFWFRLSTYLSLALSCVCLGYAEWGLLREVSAFAALVVVLLAVSFALDRRFELGLGKANLLGLGIGVLAVVWLVYNVSRPREVMRELDWPTNLLPLIAPVLMALIPAKLFRPKHVGDWWTMQGVALAGVMLAAAMEDNAVFMALLVAYAVTAVWSLVLFFYRRNGGFVPPVPNGPPPAVVQVLTADPFGRSPRWLFARSAVWLGLAAAVALPLFLVLPRPGGASWAYAKRKFEVGQSGETTIDLNKTGELTRNEEVAYHLFVSPTHAGEPVDLPAEQLWRARAFTEYARGAWSRGTAGPTVIPAEPVDPTRPRTDSIQTEPADFGPAGFAIEFEPSDKERFPVLASPTRWVPRKLPVRWVSTGGVWQRGSDGSFIGLSAGGRIATYRQVCGPPSADGLGQPFETRSDPDVLPILRKSLPYAAEYAADLLDQLVRDGDLPAAAVRVNDPRGRTAPEYHEQVARLFARHVADSGRFAYSTVLRREDQTLDPLEDFLKNTRAGNCELFATALVLLLRGVDVPAQFVSGYKGWGTDDDGRPVIHRYQAHTWVEVLVSRPPDGFAFHPTTPPDRRKKVWHWLSLDPTPADTAATQTSATGWYTRFVWLLNDYLTGYDQEKRKQAIEAAARAGGRYGPAAAGLLAVGLAAGWAWRRHARRRQAALAAAVGPPWYGVLVDRLRRRGYIPVVGETPREYAERAAAGLRAAGSVAADVPPFVVSKLYRVRYAGVPLTADEESAVAAALDKMAAATPEAGR